MSDEKDVGVEHQKKEIEIKDNAKLDEILRGYRVLYFDKENFIAKEFGISSIRIYDKSNLSISRYGDDLFTRTRNKLIKDPEMLTQKEQLKILADRGLWGEEQEKELTELRRKAQEIVDQKSEIESLIAELDEKDKNKEQKHKKYNDKLEKVAQEWIDVYSKYMEVVALNDNFFGDTIEAQAEIAQRKGWLVSSVCKHLDDEGKPFDDTYNPDFRLWKSVEELEKDIQDKHLVSLMTECMSYWQSKEEGESFFVESPEDLIFGSDGDTAKNTESDSSQEQETPSK